MTAVVRVSVNGVEAGSLPVSQYQQIRARPKRDWYVYFSQLVIAVRVILNFIAYTLLGMPVAMVVMLILCLMSPGVIADLVDALSAHSPGQIETLARGITTYAAAVSGLAILVGCMLTQSARKLIGFKDAFAAESDRLLRVLLEISSTGPISAVEYVDENPVRQV